MKIASLIANKTAHTITANESVETLVDRLNTHRVGALVVSPDGKAVDGIVSERDVVRALAAKFDSIDTLHVRDIMTVEVRTCNPDSTVAEIMAIMTNQRIRHLPVIDASGDLLSIVSIGDVVKHHVGEISVENQALKDYVASGS